MTQDDLKRAAAQAALQFITPHSIIGVGSGSTVRCFMEALGHSEVKHSIVGAVSSSDASTAYLKSLQIRVLDPNELDTLIPVYIDGADEINPQFQMIKGGGAALTREKIVAAISKKFICICDHTKRVDVLGKFPLPVEVIPIARMQVIRSITAQLGGHAVWREGVITDNGNIIVDISGLQIHDPIQVETQLNQISGVVTNGLFAQRGADVLVLAKADGIEISHAQ